MQFSNIVVSLHHNNKHIEIMTATIEFLNPLIDLAFQMLNAKVLRKNVIKHFTNRGLSFEASENIVEIAEFRFNEFNKLKNK